MNHVILVGRITGTPEVVKIENNSRTVIILEVPRILKNHDGLYETDFIRCVLCNEIANRASEYCKEGDIVCVRGHLQVCNYEAETQEKKYFNEVIAETISFVSSKKIEVEE